MSTEIDRLTLTSRSAADIDDEAALEPVLLDWLKGSLSSGGEEDVEAAGLAVPVVDVELLARVVVVASVVGDFPVAVDEGLLDAVVFAVAEAEELVAPPLTPVPSFGVPNPIRALSKSSTV